MTMTDAALWTILALLIALVPIGCIMTRPKKKANPAADTKSHLAAVPPSSDC
jgi:hypothetical protein